MMKQSGSRFLILFILQGITVLVLVGALRTADNTFITFSAGAAFMTFVLMLLVWILSVIASNNNIEK